MPNTDMQTLEEKIDQLHREVVNLRGLIEESGKGTDQWKDEKARLEDRLSAMVSNNAFLVQKIDELEGICKEQEISLAELKQERENVVRRSQEIIKELEDKLRFLPVRIIVKLRKMLSS
jgi:chromosome segregation ATPase